MKEEGNQNILLFIQAEFTKLKWNKKDDFKQQICSQAIKFQ